MQIPRRLKVIGDLIPEGANIADIGADHGLLEHYIALSKEKYFVLAIENKKGPFLRLLNNVECLQNVVASCSDGLNRVTNEYDTLVLAGMGGDNIIEILSKKITELTKVNRIIIDAHSFIPKARRAIIDFGFIIEKEILVHERGKFYNIVSFVRSSETKSYSNDELDYGYNIINDPLFNEYKKFLLNNLKSISNKIRKVDSEKEKYNQVIEEIRRLEAYGQN